MTGIPRDARFTGHRGLVLLCAVPMTLILVFAVRRGITDVGHLRAGTLPDSPTDVAYVQHPWLAYAHIVPALLYLLGAPWQLAGRFRTANYGFHRTFGRVLVSAGLLSGVFAVVFGLAFPVGGSAEAAASTAFGAWFLVCLVLAFRAIRRGETAAHRRWMIRAFGVAIGVGTIRIWVLLLWGSGLLDLRAAFGLSFWVALVIHAGAAEWWVRTRPVPPDADSGRADADPGRADAGPDRGDAAGVRTARPVTDSPRH